MRPHTITYPPDGVEPIGVIEFVHGMCETRNRYAAPMEYFSRHGYICAIADMRGHGENILTTDDLGYFWRRRLQRSCKRCSGIYYVS